MAHPKEARLAVRREFLGGLTLEQAAAKCEVPLGTARRWKADALLAGDDWDKFQAASLIVAGGGIDAAMGRVAAALVLRAEAVMEQLEYAGDDGSGPNPIDAAKAIASLADSLGKAKAAAKALMPAADRLAIETAAIKGYVELLLRLTPSAAEPAVAAMEAYASGQR